MVTRLKKPIRRRIGGFIIEVDEEGLSIQRVRHQSGVRILFSELVAAADQIRAPRGWIPSAGERVAVLPTRHRAKVVTLIETSVELYAKIVFRRGTERIVEVSRLVPVDGVGFLVKCHRWPAIAAEVEEESLFANQRDANG